VRPNGGDEAMKATQNALDGHENRPLPAHGPAELPSALVGGGVRRCWPLTCSPWATSWAVKASGWCSSR
jgi:hypothetical protein